MWQAHQECCKHLKQSWCCGGRYFDYLEGSGSKSLFFRYTIQDEDTVADLNYNATNSLELNGGKIFDKSGNNATLTLPATTSTESAGTKSQIAVDTQKPFIKSVTSSAPDGAYKAGDQSLSM